MQPRRPCHGAAGEGKHRRKTPEVGRFVPHSCYMTDSGRAVARVLPYLALAKNVVGPALRHGFNLVLRHGSLVWDSDVCFHLGLGLALYKTVSAPALRQALRSIKLSEGNGQPEEVAGVVSHDTTAVSAARLRKRSRWVCWLASRLVDSSQGKRDIVARLIRGRWIPDLPNGEQAVVAESLKALVDGGVRILGGGTVPKLGEDGGVECFLHVRLEDGTCHTIFPSLVGELACFATFRTRDNATLMALRHRALEWGAKSKLRWFDFQQGFAGSIAFGLVASSYERAAIQVIGEAHPTALRPSA
jgi:hypothetical protein